MYSQDRNLKVVQPVVSFASLNFMQTDNLDDRAWQGTDVKWAESMAEMLQEKKKEWCAQYFKTI